MHLDHGFSHNITLPLKPPVLPERKKRKRPTRVGRFRPFFLKAEALLNAYLPFHPPGSNQRAFTASDVALSISASAAW